jgi:hypothetical protein
VSAPRPVVVRTPLAPCSRRAPTPLLLLAIFALLETTLFTTINPQFAGWLPDHGHIYRNGVPVPHTHPWQVQRPPQPDVPVCAPAPPAPPADVVFTLSQSGDAGASIAVPLLAGAFVAPCSAVVEIAPIGPVAPAMGEGVTPSVPTPPPRG